MTLLIKIQLEIKKTTQDYESEISTGTFKLVINQNFNYYLKHT